jgi:glycerol uptake facilitator-like aquaporin
VIAGYWFTASTCFANPAVAIARSLTDTFSGIRPVDAPWFIVAEVVGALLAAATFHWLLSPIGIKQVLNEDQPSSRIREVV